MVVETWQFGLKPLDTAVRRLDTVGISFLAHPMEL
jgi:hypothetical protein